MPEPTRYDLKPAPRRRLLLGLALALCAWGAPGAASAVVCGGGTHTTQAQVNALAGCTSFSDSLKIGPSADIADLTPLSGVTSVVGGGLEVQSNPLLVTLTGLSSLVSLTGSVYITNNDALTSIDALSNLTVIGLNLEIEGNAALVVLGDLSGLTSVPGRVRIDNNLALTNLDGLGNLATIGGDLKIDNDDSLTDLTGLSSLVSVGAALRFLNNLAVTSLDGLGNLATIGGDLSIQNNASLTDPTGLSSLVSVGANLNFVDNLALTSLDGLGNLATIGVDLRIYNNDSLTDLTALSSLVSVGEDLSFINNLVLTSLDGLGNVPTLGGGLTIDNNDSLTDLTALSSLVSIGVDLVVRNNLVLTSLDALAGVTTIGDDILIDLNPALSEFCGLYPVIDGGGPGDLYIVYGNLANPTKTDILNAGPCFSPVPSIVGPFDVFTSSEWGAPNQDGHRVNMINGRGLDQIGAIELQTHDASANANTMWHAGPVNGGLIGGTVGNPPPVADQDVVFDLGRTRDLLGAYVWNHNQAGETARGVDQFEILTSSNADPNTATFSSIGSFNLAQAPGNASATAELISFDVTGARLVKFDIASAHSNAPNDYVGLSEVLFATPCTVHRWSFDDPAGAAVAGTVAKDVTCGDDGTIEGTGATFTGAGLSLPGGSAGSGAGYVDLPNGLLAGLTSATFEAWYTIDGVTTWPRLFDFGTSGGAEVPPGLGGVGHDYIFYAVSRGTDINLQRAEVSKFGGTSLTLDPSQPTSLGQQVHVAVTFEDDTPTPGTSTLTVYRDGQLVSQGTTTFTLADVVDLNAWLGRSNYDGDDYLNGTIDEFRLYEEPLNLTQVIGSLYAGPDVETVVVPEPTLGLGLACGLGLLITLARRRARAASAV